MTEGEERENVARKIMTMLAERVRQSGYMTAQDLTALKIVSVVYATKGILDQEVFAAKVMAVADDWKGFAGLCEDLAANGFPLIQEEHHV